MALLATMPVNLQLSCRLARAAGRHSLWLLAQECATAALKALPEGQRDLQAVSAAADAPGVSPQAWFWLAVAEMQQGQVGVRFVSQPVPAGVCNSLTDSGCASLHCRRS
jgi:hypothetical protein